MSDFFQTGAVTTLHNLNRRQSYDLEMEIALHARNSPVGLILPALYTEFEHPAMRRIVEELSRVRYLRRIVVALGRANRQEYENARWFFRDFETPVTFLQVDHPRMTMLLDQLDHRGLPTGEPGKGRSCWLACGYLLARGDCEVFALHDCDIRNYESGIVARLCYPLTHPELDFEFAKGYYARITSQLHGRVTRLFFTPLVRAMRSLAPDAAYLHYLDSFRYALSGEFAMRASLARRSCMPSDWALETGMLSEAFRHCGMERICQMELADNYEHKHQELSPGNPAKGLRRMSRDIAKALLRTAAAHGVSLAGKLFDTLHGRYLKMAQQAIHSYHADALWNGLDYNRRQEETAVETFAGSLREASLRIAEDASAHSHLPQWNSVLDSVPRFFDLLLDAVEETDDVRPALVSGWRDFAVELPMCAAQP